jgi:hypothetical protein
MSTKWGENAYTMQQLKARLRKEKKKNQNLTLLSSSLSLFLSSSKNNMIVCPDGELDKNTSFISKIPPQKKHGSF